MTTWFNERTFDVVARNYSLSYDAAVFDFNVSMEVKMTKVGASWLYLLLPSAIMATGKQFLKKREHGIFTATLFDFLGDRESIIFASVIFF